MLFDEHGRQDDADHEHEGSIFRNLTVFPVLTATDRNVCTDGIKHMDAWKQIRRRICLVQFTDQITEKTIIQCHTVAEQMSVRIDRRCDEENGHSGKQKLTGLDIFFFILIVQIDVDKCDSHISEPQEIRDDKNRQKRNVVIQFHVYHMEMFGDCFFQICEPG